MSASHFIFVYGTLKRGLCRAPFLAGQQFVGEVRTLPRYRMFDCGSYPGLRPALHDGLSIIGELWSVDAECLARLDLEEGVAGGLYARRMIELAAPLAGELTTTCEAYFYLPGVEGYPDCGESWS